jgi:hypothetical protein
MLTAMSQVAGVVDKRAASPEALSFAVKALKTRRWKGASSMLGTGIDSFRHLRCSLNGNRFYKIGADTKSKKRPST